MAPNEATQISGFDSGLDTNGGDLENHNRKQSASRSLGGDPHRMLKRLS